MSNFIKLHGQHYGAIRPGGDSEEKTLHIRIGDIEEICDVPNGSETYKKDVTKEEYEKNKNDPDYYATEGEPVAYLKHIPTSLITIGNYYHEVLNQLSNVVMKIQASSSDIVSMIDSATVDLAVSKALAVDAARAERDAASKK